MHSDFKTSRHYRVGSCPKRLSAFACVTYAPHAGRNEISNDMGNFGLAGVAAGFGTMNPDTPIVIGERQGWVIQQIKDPFIRAYWAEEYANYDQRFRREAIAPIQNKLGQFLLNPVIRNILGQVKTKVSIPFTMDHGRVFIANLSKGRLGHDKANLLGSLLATQFQLAAMARAKLPEAERRPFFLYIDEFHNFSTDAFASILAEARKYRLCLTISHQYIDQLTLPVRQAVFGNVGTLISFRVGYADAEVLEKEFGNTFPQSALADLGRYEASVKLLEDGANREPFRAKTVAPLENRVGRKNKLIARSRERFAAPRAAVEAKLTRWLGDQNPSGTDADLGSNAT
jgi:hypothetical protein